MSIVTNVNYLEQVVRQMCDVSNKTVTNIEVTAAKIQFKPVSNRPLLIYRIETNRIRSPEGITYDNIEKCFIDILHRLQIEDLDSITTLNEEDRDNLKKIFINYYQSQLKGLMNQNGQYTNLDRAHVIFEKLFKLDQSQNTKDLFTPFKQQKAELVQLRQQKIIEIQSMTEQQLDMFRISNKVNNVKLKQDQKIIEAISNKLKNLEKNARERKILLLKGLEIQLQSQLKVKNDPNYLTYNTRNNGNNPKLIIKSKEKNIGGVPYPSIETSLQINNSNKVIIDENTNSPNNQDILLYLKLQDIFGITSNKQNVDIYKFLESLATPQNLQNAQNKARKVMVQAQNPLKFSKQPHPLSPEAKKLLNNEMLQANLNQINNPINNNTLTNDNVQSALKGIDLVEINLETCIFVRSGLDMLINKVNTSKTGGFIISDHIIRFIVRDLEFKPLQLGGGYLEGRILISSEHKRQIKFRALISVSVMEHLERVILKNLDGVPNFTTFIDRIQSDFRNQKIPRSTLKVTYMCSLLLVTLVTNGEIARHDDILLSGKNNKNVSKEQNFDKFAYVFHNKMKTNISKLFDVRVKEKGYVTNTYGNITLLVLKGQAKILDGESKVDVNISSKCNKSKKKCAYSYTKGEEKTSFYFYSEEQESKYLRKFHSNTNNSNTNSETIAILKEFNSTNNKQEKCNILNRLKRTDYTPQQKRYVLHKLETLKYTKPWYFEKKNIINNKRKEIINCLTTSSPPASPPPSGGKKKPIKKIPTKKKIGVYRTSGGYYYRRFRNGDVKRISKDEYKKRK